MKLTEFKTKLGVWLNNTVGVSVHSLEPPSLSDAVSARVPLPATYIIFPISAVGFLNSHAIVFDQIVTVTYIVNRRVLYNQLPIASLEAFWLSAVFRLTKGSDCILGEGVRATLSQIDPIDIEPTKNNQDWLLNMKLLLKVHAEFEPENLYLPEEPALGSDISTVIVNYSEPPTVQEIIL
jgi:hypothetical protein